MTINKDFIVAITASTKVLLDSEQLPPENANVKVKFKPVIVKNSSYVPITTNKEPEIKAEVRFH